ncbi:MAG TPA: CapA family protein [Candidatus Limnocylindrales bacterium]|nr:CapA family protein [Candidatus Limnocylindrales bacterium]
MPVTATPRRSRRSRPDRRAVRGAVPSIVGLIVAALLAAGCDPATSPAVSHSSGPPPQVTSEPTTAVAPATPTPSPAATPTVVRVPVVPVTDFRAPWTETSAAEVEAVLAGTSERYDGIEVLAEDQFRVLQALGLGYPHESTRFFVVPDLATLTADLATSRERLAFVFLDDVGPALKALGWEGAALFGVDRVATLEAWPLQAEIRRAPMRDPGMLAPDYDPATAWTLVAGGDILLDRGVSLAIQGSPRGADFPFDGGSVRITGRCRDCSAFGWDLPYTERTGDEGAMRELLTGADLAIANFENPAPNDFRFHPRGTVFSANPAYIEGLVNAGLDYVSLANNHIRDAGARGILETIANLEAHGLASSGAGANLAAARAPALLVAGGVTVAILGYDTIAGGYFAGPERAGSAPMTAENLTTDVAAARAAGADLVIVFPHWGTEYDPTPFAGQRKLAQAAIDAGADMVIGNHAHWAAGIEVYQGKPIWYALGNFVFDQTWSEPTMEGITLELTFDATRLVQVRMRPHLILDRAQPNFMDPAGSGAVVMGQVWAASEGLLDW